MYFSSEICSNLCSLLQWGCTALIRAAMHGYVDCARMLIDAGAEKDTKDNVCAVGNFDCWHPPTVSLAVFQSMIYLPVSLLSLHVRSIWIVFSIFCPVFRFTGRERAVCGRLLCVARRFAHRMVRRRWCVPLPKVTRTVRGCWLMPGQTRRPRTRCVANSVMFGIFLSLRTDTWCLCVRTTISWCSIHDLCTIISVQYCLCIQIGESALDAARKHGKADIVSLLLVRISDSVVPHCFYFSKLQDIIACTVFILCAY